MKWVPVFAQFTTSKGDVRLWSMRGDERIQKVDEREADLEPVEFLP